MRQAFYLTRGCFFPIINNTCRASCAMCAQPLRRTKTCGAARTQGQLESAARGCKKQKKGISGCSAVGARSRAPPAAETARRKCWAAMRAMQGRAKAAAARHMATESAPRAAVKNRRREYRGVAQLVARHIWDVDAVGSNPATPTISSVHNGFELWALDFLCQSGSLYVWSRSLSCPFVLCKLGSILNCNPFSGIRLAIASVRWNSNHSNKLVVNHDSLVSVLTHAFCLVNRNRFNHFPQQRHCQHLHFHKPPYSTNELLFIFMHSFHRIKPFPEFGNSAFQF